MKKFILIFISVLLTAATFAQNVPQTVNFSATVRDVNNEPLSNTEIIVRIAFSRDDFNSEMYWEEHKVTTNVNGFVSFLLNREPFAHGEGSFDGIQWQDGPYTMKVQYKRPGDDQYEDLGSHDITSVFYAFVSNYAFTAYTAQNLERFAINVANAQDGDVLVYNSQTGKWEASSILSQLQETLSAVTCKITFDENGGTGTMNPQTMVKGAAQALTRNAFTNGNYPFNGWNTKADGSGTSYTDGHSITATTDMTLYAQWSDHQFVDLGLSTKWATCNVGANSPEEYGDYFAWGETTPKENYSWSTYRWCNGSNTTLTKYCNNSNYGNGGFTDTLTTLKASDDAATANWGSAWRMPTNAQMQELKENCEWEWTTEGDVYGYRVTGNGNSIFLPAAGNRSGSELGGAGSYGYYWSSSFYSYSPPYARYLYFGSGGYMGYNLRYFGQSVRPVCAQ